MKHFLISIFAASLVSTAHAESNAMTLPLAKQLIDLLHFKDSLQSAQASCGAELPNTSFDPSYVYKKDPRAFKGISPSSHLWPEVEEAYRLYRIEYCHSQDVADLLDLMASVYADKLSEDQLRSAIEFYESPAGQALSSISKDATLAFQARQQERAAQIQRTMEENFHARLNSAYRKFQEEQIEQCPNPNGKKKA
jgi:hypothetical protein